MRVLEFDGSNPDHHERFNALCTAWFWTDRNGFGLVPIATSAARIESALEVNRALRAASIERGPTTDLRPEGARIELRDSALELLREVWAAYRARLTPALLEVAKAVDDLLADAPRAEAPVHAEA